MKEEDRSPRKKRGEDAGNVLIALRVIVVQLGRFTAVPTSAAMNLEAAPTCWQDITHMYMSMSGGNILVLRMARSRQFPHLPNRI